MKDYRLDRKADPNYIVDVTSKTSGAVDGKKVETLSVKFADGRVFKNIVCDENNIDKIIKQQEKQAKKGVENINVFEKRRTKAGILTGTAIIYGPLVSKMVDSISNAANQTESDPVSFGILTGVITLGSLIPGVYSLLKNHEKVKELKKIKFLNSNKNVLQTYPDYENALVGLPKSKQKWFEEMKQEGEDPFCITEIDMYTENDLKQIIENMDTEKAYQFTYVPRQTRTTKK